MEQTTNNICSSCGQDNRIGAKFCGHCGRNIVASKTEENTRNKKATSADLNRFKNFINEMLLEGGDPIVELESLIEDAEELGIDKNEALSIIEETQTNAQKAALGVNIYYDSTVASLGIANGNTLLSIKVENTTNKNIDSVEINITHPETQKTIQLPYIKNLGRGKVKNIELPLLFSLAGQQSIREGLIHVIALSGAVEVYRFSNSIRLSTENGNVSRTNVVKQSITTNAVATIDTHEISAGSVSIGGPNWEQIQLIRVNAKNSAVKKLNLETEDSIECDVDEVNAINDSVITTDVAEKSSQDISKKIQNSILLDPTATSNLMNEAGGNEFSNQLIEDSNLSPNLIESESKLDESAQSTIKTLDEFSTPPTGEEITYKEIKNTKKESSNAQLNNTTEELTIYKPLLEDKKNKYVDLSNHAVTKSLTEFFESFSFVSQNCEEKLPRKIHLCTAEKNHIEASLINKLKKLISDDDFLIGVCEEDHESRHSSDGALLGWYGTATVITTKGIYHVSSSRRENYEIDSINSFCKWKQLFFRLNADLHIDIENLAIWLGNKNQYFIRGTFINFEKNIDSFIYFNENLKSELKEKFRNLRNEILDPSNRIN